MHPRLTPPGPVSLTDGPGYLTALLDSPDTRNPLSAALVDALLRAVEEAQRRPGCHALVIRAAGPAFCTGLPLAPGRAPWHRGATPWDLFEKLADSAVPTVAVVDGEATGGGTALAAACDLVIAAPGARWRLTEGLLGLVPAMALPFLARRIGPQRALTLVLTAEEIDAPTAERLGLADRLAADPDTELRRCLRDLRRLPPGTVGALKRYRRRAFPWPPDLGAAAAALLDERLASPETRTRLAGLTPPGSTP
ncbi:enoyl-CoA hydratase/isomerase family protein [Kitasatospora sp. NPDC088134]|uniref:enoyl-CoA hydratase/isomerase family protein n=1 Tax=Kitasatospora sp. NPDC088134 TaxID=3364071 RepID=UPI00382EEAD6